MHRLTEAIIACDKLKPTELQIIKELIEETQTPQTPNLLTMVNELAEELSKVQPANETVRSPMQRPRNRQKNTLHTTHKGATGKR